MVSTDLQTHMVSLSEIVPYAGNAKEHPEWQVDQLVSSIEKFGNCDPIAAWHNQRGQLEVVEGHGRLMALEKLGYEEAPVIFLDHLTDEQRPYHDTYSQRYAADMAAGLWNTDNPQPIIISDTGKVIARHLREEVGEGVRQQAAPALAHCDIPPPTGSCGRTTFVRLEGGFGY